MAKSLRYDAIYARQSVDKKDSVSIESQIEECKKLCSANIKVYQDKGYSGKNTERPQVRELIKDIESGIIEKVIVYKLDRISRNITDFYKLYGIMELHDCEFISWDEGFDTTTTMGRAMMGILAVFAQMERENIQTRIKDNYNYRMEQNSAVASNNTPNHNLKELSGLLKCAECGSAVKMQAYPTLTCTGRNQKKICSVSFKGVKLETVQDNVAAQVQSYLENLNETQMEKNNRRKKEKKEIAKLEKELENMIELAKHSDDIAEWVKIDIDNLIVKIKEKQLKLKTDRKDDIIGLRLASGGNRETLKSIFDKDGVLMFHYSELDIERKQMVLKVLVDKIYVYKDGSVKIEWKE